MKKKYVLGFMFSMDGTKVCVIQKEQPVWQKGKLNGVGGKIEPNELPFEAMKREFWEETGVAQEQWELRARSESINHDMWIYRCFSDSIFNVSTMTNEKVMVLDVREAMHAPNVVENLRFFIPYLLDKRSEGAPRLMKLEY